VLLERVAQSQLNLPRSGRERAVVGVQERTEGRRVVDQRRRGRRAGDVVESRVGQRVIEAVEHVEGLERHLEPVLADREGPGNPQIHVRRVRQPVRVALGLRQAVGASRAKHARLHAHRGGLRGIKRDLYEGGIRVPFIAYQKGVTKEGAVNEMPAALWDLFPTFLEMARVKQVKNIDGISILPALKGHKQKEHEYFYWEFHEAGGRQAVRFGNWKGVRLNVSTTTNAPLELYDLKTDPQEKNNIASQHPDVVKQIEAFMKEAYVPNKDWPLMVSEIRK